MCGEGRGGVSKNPIPEKILCYIIFSSLNFGRAANPPFFRALENVDWGGGG